MGLREIDRQAVEQAMREFDSIGRDKFLRKYGFGPAREYFIVQGDDLYDSKAVLGAAHGYAVPEAGPLGREDFSGGEQNTAKRLRQLGVEVKKITLKAVLEQVLDLQAKWKAAKTDTMRKRGRLVEEVGPVVLRGVIKASSADDFSTEGSNGTGSISRVPWMRIFRPEHSPAATEGWYLVYLFAADGSMVYLSLNQGTTESVRVKSGQRFKSRPKDELATKVAEARALINKEGDDLDKYLLEIKLGDKGPLGRGYERGNVLARQYDSGDLSNETGLTGNACPAWQAVR